MTAKERREHEAREKLREFVKPGATVYTIIRHVSRSGMTRVIDPYIIEDGEPRWIGRYVSDALSWSYDDKKQGVRVGGCGMDMGFHLVYTLSIALFLDKARHMTDKQLIKANEKAGTRPDCGPWESGYWLKQRWM